MAEPGFKPGLSCSRNRLAVKRNCWHNEGPHSSTTPSPDSTLGKAWSGEHSLTQLSRWGSPLFPLSSLLPHLQLEARAAGPVGQRSSAPRGPPPPDPPFHILDLISLCVPSPAPADKRHSPIILPLGQRTPISLQLPFQLPA